MYPVVRAGLALISLTCVSCTAETAAAQARAQFAVDVLATCQKPAVRDVPIHVEGTGILKTDGSARVDVDGGALGRTRYRTKLGQTSAAAGGSAGWTLTLTADG